MDALEFRQDGLTISTDKTRVDVALIHDFLSNHSYWAKGRPLTVVQRSIDNALCFGMYDDNAQIGFARVITDQATFAYLADVFIVEAYRGRGLSKWLMRCILEVPDLRDVRRFMLITSTAHTLYAQFGFTVFANPERIMERFTQSNRPTDSDSATRDDHP